MRTLRAVAPWVRPYKGQLFGALAAMLVSVLINLSIPLLTARVIDDGIAADDQGLVIRTALLMVALIVAGMIASAIASIMGVRLAFNAVTDLRRDLYSHAQRLTHRNLDRLSTGEILTRLTSDMTKVGLLLSMGVSFMAQIPVMFIGALIAVVGIDASLVAIVLVMVPIIGLVVWYALTQSKVMYDAVQQRIDRLNTVLQENIHGAEVIKAFVRQDHESERFNEVADDLALRATRVNQLVASLFPNLIVVSSLAIAAVLWMGGLNVIDGRLSEGDLVAFISYMAMITMPLMMFAFLQPTVSAATASMARISEVFDTEPDVIDPVGGRDLTSSPNPGEIVFHGVSFRYDEVSADGGPVVQHSDALCDIDLTVKAGTTVAILGATGSGKSTLIHLIPRFYDVNTGTITVGGIDVRELSISSLRRHVAIALQQPELFRATIAENIRFARPEATDEDVRAAARAAQAAEFIEDMTEGYDSMVAQGGSNLSGGQRQRLSLARALVAKPTILILDDSTSAVDNQTEALIQDALDELGNTTVVLVAQRISSALAADEIVVLDEGRIVAQGSHDALLAGSSIYQDIYRSQLGEPVA